MPNTPIVFDDATALEYLVALSQRGNRYTTPSSSAAAARERSDEILAATVAPIRDTLAAIRTAITNALPQLTDAQLAAIHTNAYTNAMYEHTSSLYNDFQQNVTPMFRTEQTRRMALIAAAHPLPVTVGSIVRVPDSATGRMRTAYMRVTSLQMQPPVLTTMSDGTQRTRYPYTVVCESVKPDGTPVTGRNARSHRFEWTPESCPRPVDPTTAAQERRAAASATRAARRLTIQQQLTAAQQREAELAAQLAAIRQREEERSRNVAAVDAPVAPLQLEALQSAIAESVGSSTAATIQRRYTASLQAATRQTRVAEDRQNCVSRDEE